MSIFSLFRYVSLYLFIAFVGKDPSDMKALLPETTI